LCSGWRDKARNRVADHSDYAALAEPLLKYTFAALLKERQEDLAFFDQRIEKGLVAKLEGIVGSEFAHTDYDEAIQMLERANEKFEFPVNWGVDLQSEHERYLIEKYVKKPVIVMNYPKDIKAFYVRLNGDGRTVAAMDVLAPGIGEIIGGSQREERLDVLDRSMAERGIDRDHYAWYRDLRRHGMAPHAGFGLAPVSPGAPSPTSPALPTCATLCCCQFDRRGCRQTNCRHSRCPGLAASTTTQLP
jgi:asparaginyl-tRNA synthetase